MDYVNSRLVVEARKGTSVKVSNDDYVNVLIVVLVDNGNIEANRIPSIDIEVSEVVQDVDIDT